MAWPSNFFISGIPVQEWQIPSLEVTELTKIISTNKKKVEKVAEKCNKNCSLFSILQCDGKRKDSKNC